MIFVGREIDRRVHLREFLQRRGQRLHQKRGDRDRRSPFGFRLLRQPLAQRFDAGDVGAIVLKHVRHGVPRLRQPVRGRAAHAAHRLALDRSPLAEVGQRLCRRRRRTRPAGARQQPPRIRGDVVHRDAAAGARALNILDVHAELAREPARRRRGRNRRAVAPPSPAPPASAQAGAPPPAWTASSRRHRLCVSRVLRPPSPARPPSAAPPASASAFAGCWLSSRLRRDGALRFRRRRQPRSRRR